MLHSDDVVSTPMGAPGEDVRLSHAARTLLPLSLECKCVEKINIWDCIAQAKANCPTGATPCLAFTRNRSPAYAVVPWEFLLELFKTQHHANGNIPPRLKVLLGELCQFANHGDAPASTPGVAERATQDPEDAAIA